MRNSIEVRKKIPLHKGASSAVPEAEPRLFSEIARDLYQSGAFTDLLNHLEDNSGITVGIFGTISMQERYGWARHEMNPSAIVSMASVMHDGFRVVEVTIDKALNPRLERETLYLHNATLKEAQDALALAKVLAVTG